MWARAIIVHLSRGSPIWVQVVREGFLEEAEPVQGFDRWQNKLERYSSSRTRVRKVREKELNMWQMSGQGGVGNGSGEFEEQ